VNAGPRHRFVVLGDDGRPLIVHNCENWTQAVARDVFFRGMRRARDAGFKVVLRVHDELVAEVPADGPLGYQQLAEHMGVNPGWAAGLPLAAAGFDACRYRKE
jgi:DNA polymerase